MANHVRFIYANQAEEMSVTATDEATGFPVEAAVDADRSTIWKANTAYTSGFLRVDLGAAATISGLGLANHNIGTLTGTQKLQYSDNDAAWSDAKTIAPAATGDYFARAATTWGSHRYWRLLLNSSGAERAYVGEFYLGTVVELDFNPDTGFNEEDVWQSFQSASISGRQVVKEAGRQTRLFTASWAPTTAAVKGAIRTVLVAQSGPLHPFFYVPRNDGADTTEGAAYFVRLAANRWTAEELHNNYWNVTLNLEEQQ